MKRFLIKYILLLVIGSMSLSSCSKFLEENPYGAFTNSNYFNNEADALSALYYSYSTLNYIEFTARFMFNMGDVASNQYKMYNRSEATKFYTWDIDSNTEELLYFYKYCYITIMRSNNVLENVAVMENISDEARNQILGEAYYLRAFSYFMLVKNYGSVPYRSKVATGSNDMTSPKVPINELYGYIISDLENAASLMDIKKKQGRVDRVGAQALLSKVYVTMASSKMTGAPGYEWVSDYEDAYAKAAYWADLVLNKQYDYGLEPNIDKVYDVDSQSESIEHIHITSMERSGHGQEGVFSQLPPMFGIVLVDYYIPVSVKDGNKAVRKYINSGESNWSFYRVDKAFYDLYDNADLRKRFMATKVYNEDGTVRAELDLTDTGEFFFPFCCKYADYKTIGYHSSANIYLMRFAEVALNYAEAVGPTTEGYKWINKVRERAGLGELPAGLGLDEFRKKVWDEMELEFAFEGHGIYDLRRTNRVMEKVTNKTVKAEYAYFYPLPQRELDLNK